jgi:hypothetical protein
VIENGQVNGGCCGQGVLEGITARAPPSAMLRSDVTTHSTYITAIRPQIFTTGYLHISLRHLFLASMYQVSNSEQRTANSEQRTANSEQRTANSEQRTANSEQRTAAGWSDTLLYFHTAASPVGIEQRFGGSGFLFAAVTPQCGGIASAGDTENHLCGSTDFLFGGRKLLCGTENHLCGGSEFLFGDKLQMCDVIDYLYGGPKILFGDENHLCGTENHLCDGSAPRCSGPSQHRTPTDLQKLSFNLSFTKNN